VWLTQLSKLITYFRCISSGTTSGKLCNGQHTNKDLLQTVVSVPRTKALNKGTYSLLIAIWQDFFGIILLSSLVIRIIIIYSPLTVLTNNSPMRTASSLLLLRLSLAVEAYTDIHCTVPVMLRRREEGGLRSVVVRLRLSNTPAPKQIINFNYAEDSFVCTKSYNCTLALRNEPNSVFRTNEPYDSVQTSNIPIQARPQTRSTNVQSNDIEVDIHLCCLRESPQN
jgi:hypothetical protein